MNLRIKIPKQIIILLALAIILNLLRVVLFNNTTFLYMFWNIFLALIPFLISSIILLNVNKSNFLKPQSLISLFIWFLFLPNTFYVLTDFIHLGRIYGVPVWYDIFVLFSSTTVSLLMGLYSLRHLEEICQLKFSKRLTSAILIIVILFASFGVYLGRFLRFNSWDFFVSHSSLFLNIWQIFTKENNYVNVYSYTFTFFLFILFCYWAFKETKSQ